MLADCIRQSYNYYSNTFFGNILDYFSFVAQTPVPLTKIAIFLGVPERGMGGGDLIPITDLPAPAARYSPLFFDGKVIFGGITGVKLRFSNIGV
jgi:hypothetical protein